MAIPFHPIRGVKAGLKAAGRTMFGYHATTDKQRRTAPRSATRSEDDQLDVSNRRKLIATTREARRNQTLLKWMVDSHLDFVTRFRFQPKTGDRDLDEQLERLVNWRSRAKNWDATGRHYRDRYMRLMEAHRVIDGDVGNLLLGNGRIQGIEGDRIAKPTQGMLPEPWSDTERYSWTHGINTTSEGRPTHYMISNRSGNGSTSMTFGKVVQARNMKLLGYWDRFDQLRGVSPLASAINTAADLYETLEAARVKAKVQAMFGIFIERETSAENGDGFDYTDADTGESPTSTTTDYDFELEPGLKLEGNPGDKITTIESRSPSSEFQQFTELESKIILLALGIPFTWLDSRRSSYSAMRQDMVRYMKTVEDKRADLHEFLMEVSAWDIARWSQLPDKENPSQPMLPLPAGMRPRDIAYEWVSDGIPWIDPLREVQADALAVANGFKTRDDVNRERRGRRYIDTVEQLGREEQQAIDASATIAIGQPGQITTRDEEEGNEANTGGADNADT